MFSCGYTAVDFMNPEDVTDIPNPEGKPEDNQEVNIFDNFEIFIYLYLYILFCLFVCFLDLFLDILKFFLLQMSYSIIATQNPQEQRA